LGGELMTRSTREPPRGAPPGTVWFGGPVDKCDVALWIRGDDLVPDEITTLLGHPPSSSSAKGATIVNSKGEQLRTARTGTWSLSIESRVDDVEDVILELLGRLPEEPSLWLQLSRRYRTYVNCALFLDCWNRGFELSPEACQALSARYLTVGFDIYCPQAARDRQAE